MQTTLCHQQDEMVNRGRFASKKVARWVAKPYHGMAYKQASRLIAPHFVCRYHEKGGEKIDGQYCAEPGSSCVIK